MDYQEKILDILAKNEDIYYHKLLYYYKLGNNELFDLTVSETFSFLLERYPYVLESGKLYGKSFCTKNELGELHGPYEIYADDDIIKKGCFKNDLQDGLYEIFHGQQLVVRCFFKDDRLNGLYRNWYTNGQIEVKCFYENGKQNGLFQFWYENGQIEVKSFYKNGKREGLRQEWHDNGQLKFKCYFKNDSYHGVCMTWDTDGSLISSDDYGMR